MELGKSRPYSHTCLHEYNLETFKFYTKMNVILGVKSKSMS